MTWARSSTTLLLLDAEAVGLDLILSRDWRETEGTIRVSERRNLRSRERVLC
jgi:hypothetical protein